MAHRAKQSKAELTKRSTQFESKKAENKTRYIYRTRYLENENNGLRLLKPIGSDKRTGQKQHNVGQPRNV